MRRSCSFLILVLTFLSVCAQGQQLSEVTLYSRIAYQDWTRSTFDFGTGERGLIHSPNGGWLDYDVSYGHARVGPSKDLLMVNDRRSMIADLGKKTWEQVRETPSFPERKTKEPPRPLNPPKVLINQGKEISAPYKQFIEVNAGHIYLIRLLKSRKVIYVMFRVESVKIGDNCVLTWKRVPPPKVDNEK